MVGDLMDMDEVNGVCALDTIGFIALSKAADLIAVCIFPGGTVCALEEMTVLNKVAGVRMDSFGCCMAVHLVG